MTKKEPEVPTKQTDDESKIEGFVTSTDSAKYARSRFERASRLRTVMTVVPGVIGLLILLLPSEFWYRLSPYFVKDERFGFYMSTGALLLLATSVLGVIMFYLQTGFKRDFRESEQLLDYEIQFNRLRNEVSHSVSSADVKALEALDKRLAALEKTQCNKTPNIRDFPEREKLVSEIANRLQTEGTKELLSRLEKQVQEQVAWSYHAKTVDEQSNVSARRLNGEITALGWRGNLNLGLGIITTVIGLVLLGYYVVHMNPQPEQLSAFAIQFIPRLSLVIFIEVFAYFFLRLYKSSLSEIKFFQNEMTNLELKFAALRTALELSDTNTASHVMTTLANTERNHVLKKGETTVLLEQQKYDKELAAEIAKHVAEAVTAAAKK